MKVVSSFRAVSSFFPARSFEVHQRNVLKRSLVTGSAYECMNFKPTNNFGKSSSAMQAEFSSSSRFSRSDRGPSSRSGEKRRPREYDRDNGKRKEAFEEKEVSSKADEENLKLIKEPFAILTRGKARLFKEGNPIVYNGAIEEVRRDPKPGDFILVTDQHGNPVGRGFFNPFSQYRVRLITFAHEKPVTYLNASLEEVLSAKIRKAIHLRAALFQSSSSSKSTTAYRLINGEGDGLSGCIVDVFDDYVVIQSSAYWVEQHKALLEEVFQKAIKQHPFYANRKEEMKIIWKQSESRLTQDGYKLKKKGEQEEGERGTEEGSEKVVDKSLSVIIQENGIKYQLSPYLDQKTGFYCDQRENRELIQSLVHGKHVLDLFCYTGGFSLHAALRGNPLSVTAVDSSPNAIERARLNYQLNLDTETTSTSSTIPIDFIEDDCINIMKDFKEKGKEFDFIICDPPKLAPTKQTLNRAKGKYQQINTLAMNLINQVKGGYLFTFTCSAAMSQPSPSSSSSNEFMSMLQDCAKANNRFITVLKVVGAGTDHPVALSYPESHYLTGVLLYIH